MFKDTFTIYRYEQDESYSRQVVSGVYWQEETGITPSGNGVSCNKSVTVITSPETTSLYGTEWTVKAKDRVVKGEGETITSVKELTDSYTVMSVAINTAGSDIDNITITGA